LVQLLVHYVQLVAVKVAVLTEIRIKQVTAVQVVVRQVTEFSKQVHRLLQVFKALRVAHQQTQMSQAAAAVQAV
jgi:hypothetical protein